MRTVRVYSAAPLRDRTATSLTGEAANHVGRVLRMRVGDPLVLFDGTGFEFRATITAVGRKAVDVEISGQDASLPESTLHSTLWHGVCRSSRMDYVVQKATELGINSIQPVITSRSVVKLDADRAAGRQEHWQKIAIGAAEQSGRGNVPDILLPAPLETLLAEPVAATAAIMLHPDGTEAFAELLPGLKRLTLLTGPEGGFTDTECEAAIDAGFRLATLGQRVLRSETAPVAALALAQGLAGDLSR